MCFQEILDVKRYRNLPDKEDGSSDGSEQNQVINKRVSLLIPVQKPSEFAPRKAIDRFIPHHSSPIVTPRCEFGEKIDSLRRDMNYLNRDFNRTSSMFEKFVTKHEDILYEPNYNEF